MEWAIICAKPEDLKSWDKTYGRVYLGNEFCQQLIPAPEDLKRVVHFALDRKLNFSLLTSSITEDMIKHVQILFRVLSREAPESEVIINDWGVLHILKDYKLRPVIGRLLTKQKRDPRILKIMDRLPRAMQERSKGASIGFRLVDFLSKFGVERLEMDNLLQGIVLDRSGYEGLHFSLYFPYNYLTTTRFCPYGPACNSRCRGERFRILRHRSMPVPLLVRGNTVFFENRKMPENLHENGIDRIVFQAG